MRDVKVNLAVTIRVDSDEADPADRSLHGKPVDQKIVRATHRAAKEFVDSIKKQDGVVEVEDLGVSSRAVEEK
jgi:hypothetical protein